MNVKTPIRFILFAVVCILAASMLAGCNVISEILPQTPSPEQTSVPATATPIPTTATSVEDEPITLVIWLPPQFDPANGSESGLLLQSRLEEYTSEHSRLQVVVRIKAETGDASILKSLDAASKAAPLALPDLILASSRIMRNAADSNLIYPYPAGYPAEDDNDWYNAADLMGTYNQQRYGLPLAADALVMTYKIDSVNPVPTSWDDLLNSNYILNIPAADPDAVFTLACYIADGGHLVDEDNNLVIEEGPLREVFNFYQEAARINLLPYWLSSYDTDEVSWDHFVDGNSTLAVTWVSRYFQVTDENIGAAPLPTPTGTPFTLVKGWSWSLANPDPNRQAAAAELAYFLTESMFASGWTQATGYMPLRPSAVARWEDSPIKAISMSLLPSAEAFPSPSAVAQFSPKISSAVLSLIKREQTAEEALTQVLGTSGQ